MNTNALPCYGDDVFVRDGTKDDVVSAEGRSEVVDGRKLRPRKSDDSLQSRDIAKKVRLVARKTHRSVDDEVFLEQHRDVVKAIETRKSAYIKLKERTKEVEDDVTVLREKVLELSKLIMASRHVVAYTGAGISTSANIPDYRGVSGVWTQLSNGEKIKMGSNPTSASPTFTHMAISALVARNIIKYVTSQNCDGLHLRSAVPVTSLAELHGNMFAELCQYCGKSYYRVFDVTESTGLRRHATKRHCSACDGQLRDTIVHFGELSASRWPHNWTDAERNAEESDLILCLGSSLKVLRLYKKLWLTERKKSLRPKLCIVNVQWTPKDSQAHLKINGRTDDVMRMLMDILDVEVPNYKRNDDLLFELATPLKLKEKDSYTTNSVMLPNKYKLKFSEENQKYEEWLKTSATYSDGNLKNLQPSGDSKESFSLESNELCSNHEISTCLATVSEKDPVNSDVPAWFGKGCRKLVRKKSRIKRRRKTQ